MCWVRLPDGVLKPLISWLDQGLLFVLLTPRGSLGRLKEQTTERNVNMCMSPDELTNEQLETGIASLQQLIDEDAYPHYNDYYQRRIELYEQLLKERAESGEYVNH